MYLSDGFTSRIIPESCVMRNYFNSPTPKLISVGDVTDKGWRTDIERWRIDFIRWRTGTLGSSQDVANMLPRSF